MTPRLEQGGSFRRNLHPILIQRRPAGKNPSKRRTFCVRRSLHRYTRFVIAPDIWDTSRSSGVACDRQGFKLQPRPELVFHKLHNTDYLTFSHPSRDVRTWCSAIAGATKSRSTSTSYTRSGNKSPTKAISGQHQHPRRQNLPLNCVLNFTRTLLSNVGCARPGWWGFPKQCGD
jgi:hypothetical protein